VIDANFEKKPDERVLLQRIPSWDHVSIAVFRSGATEQPEATGIRG
jgi:hypothetical protein